MLYIKKLLHSLLLILGCASMWACDMMEYHPYDTRFSGARNINALNVERIEQKMQGRKEMKIAVISDTQRWYDETHKMVNHINANKDIDFVIHCGDLTDFSLTEEFVWMRDELQHLNVPYVVALGNHDCLGTGKNTFLEMFGHFEYSFTAGNTHFVVLNTNGYEFEDADDFYGEAFLRRNLAHIPSEAERTVVVMHVPLGSDQFPLDEAEDYLEEVEKYPNVQFGVCGHEHSTSIRNPFPNHMTYYQAACADKRSYLLFHLKADGTYTYEEVLF